MQANPAMSATSARITALGAAAGTAAQAGFSRLRAGASSLLSALGGPLGVALVGAGVGIMAVGSRSQNTTAYLAALEDRSKSVASAQHSLGEALRATQGEFDDTATQAAIDSIDKYRSSLEQVASTAPGAMDTVGMAMDYLWTGLWKGSDAARDVAQSFTEQKHATSEAQAAIEQLNASGMSNAQIFSRMASDTSWDALLAQMSRLGIEGGEQLNLWRDRIMSAADAAKTATPGTTELAEAFATLGNNAASADDKTNALKRALDALAGNQSAQEAVQQHNEVIRSTAEAAWDAANGIDNFGNALINNDGTINTTSANGSKLRDTLLEIRDSTAAAIGSGADMGPVWDKNNQALDQAAAQLGLTREQMDGLAASIGYVPKYMELAVKAGGIESVSGQVVALSAMIQDAPDLSIETKIEDQAVLDKLRSLGYTIQDLPNGNVKVTAATEEAKQNMKSVVDEANALDGTKKDVKIGANTGEFESKKGVVDQQLFGLDGTIVAPTIDGNKVPLDEKVAGAGGQLLGLTGQSANPTIGAEKTPFDTSIWGANSQLFGFDQSSGSATLSAEDQAFFGSLNAANMGVWGFGSMYSAATLGANATPAHNNTAFARDDINSISSLFPIATLDANGEPAHTNTSSARSDIESINNAKGTGKLDADNSSVQPNVSAAQGWINGLLGRTVTVTFKAVYEGFRDMIGGGNFRGGAWNGTRALPGFASGGHSGYRLPKTGPGTNVTDGFVAFDSNNVPAARLDAGEWIINRRNSEKYNKELAQINAGTFPKLPGYADGGKHGIRSPKQMLDFVWNRTSDGQSRALDGAPYDWAGINWGDCSAAMAAIARFAVGLAPFAGRFATSNQRESLAGMGFTIGRGRPGDLRFGWWNGGPGGGHTFGTLPDGTNVEMRGGGRGGIIGKDAWAWNHPQATDHAFLPMPSFKFAGASGLEAFKPPTIGAADETSTATGGMGAYAASQAGYSGGGKDNTPKTWSDVAGQSAYNFVSGMTEDVLGVFGVPNDLPPLLQAYNMMQDAEEHGGVSTWDVSQAAAKLKQYEAEIELRKRVVAEGYKAVDLMRDSKIGDPGIGVLSAAENKLEDEVKLLRTAAVNADLAKARLDELLETREAAALAKQAGNTSGMSTADLGDAAGGLGEFPNTDFPDNINKELRISYDPAGGAEQWRPLVEHILAAKGFSTDKATVDSVIRRIDQESTGNPRAVNNWDSNAAAGHPTGGLLQTRDDTFKTNADPGFDQDMFDPESNIRASMNYAISRYGSLRAAYDRAGGYWKGGPIPFGSGTRDDVPLVAAEGEYIVNRFAAARNRGLLEDINSGRSAEPRGGDTYNVYAFDLESSMKELDKRAKQRAFANMGVR